jgi:hypothetical protein
MEYEGSLFWKKDFFCCNEPPPLVPEKDKREREKVVQVFKESSRKQKEITELQLNCMKTSTPKFPQGFLISEKVNETVSQYVLGPIPRFLNYPIYRR